MREFARRNALLIMNLTLLILTSCVPGGPTRAPRPVPSPAALTRLLLDTSAMPDGWHVSQGPEEYPKPQGQEDGMYVGYSTEDFGSPTLHIVLRYEDKQYAARKYKQYLPAYFDSVGRLTSWKSPSSLTHRSEIADQFRSECADFETLDISARKYTMCVTMAQYEKYVSIFITYIAEGVMNYADLEDILQAIDKRMLTYLEV